MGTDQTLGSTGQRHRASGTFAMRFSPEPFSLPAVRGLFVEFRPGRALQEQNQYEVGGRFPVRGNFTHNVR